GVLALGVLANLRCCQSLAIGRDCNPRRDRRLAVCFGYKFKRSVIDTLVTGCRVRRCSTTRWIILAVKCSNEFGVEWLPLRIPSIIRELDAARRRFHFDRPCHSWLRA